MIPFVFFRIAVFVSALTFPDWPPQRCVSDASFSLKGLLLSCLGSRVPRSACPLFSSSCSGSFCSFYFSQALTVGVRSSRKTATGLGSFSRFHVSCSPFSDRSESRRTCGPAALRSSSTAALLSRTAFARQNDWLQTIESNGHLARKRLSSSRKLRGYWPILLMGPERRTR